MILQELIVQYGYIILFLGTILEGETILIIGGFLAHEGYFSFLSLIVIASIAAIVIDESLFFLGRFKGNKILSKYPNVKLRTDKIKSLFEKYDSLFILVFRFIYGTRTATPIIMGTTKIKTLKFVLLNIIGILIWVITVSSLGYLFGEAAKITLGKIKHLEIPIILGLICLGAIIWIRRIRKNRNKNVKHIKKK